jgi:hypothetical protein
VIAWVRTVAVAFLAVAVVAACGGGPRGAMGPPPPPTGFLDQAEIQAENDRRYAASGTGYTPLIDWNRDGKIDFTEFAATARSVFEEIDKDHNGVLEGAELRVPPIRRGVPRRGGLF